MEQKKEMTRRRARRLMHLAACQIRRRIKYFTFRFEFDEDMTNHIEQFPLCQEHMNSVEYGECIHATAKFRNRKVNLYVVVAFGVVITENGNRLPGVMLTHRYDSLAVIFGERLPSHTAYIMSQAAKWIKGHARNVYYDED